MIVYLARVIQAFVMYCVNGTSSSSLLIESTDSMIESTDSIYRSGRILLANLPIMLFPYAHKFYALISAHYSHIMLEYPNRITGQENNYSNYLTFINPRRACAQRGLP